MKKLTLLLFIFSISFISQAQTADEILSNYFENIGGLENLKNIEGVKMSTTVNQMGMEFPVEIIQLKDGKQMSTVKFQGKEIKQGVFDGEILWGHNFRTMKPEKSDAETTANFKLEANDFMDPFINYKDKGYTVELLGKETIDGADTYKIKLVKEPVTVDGNQEESVNYYFFDTENYIPIAVQSEIKSGPEKGKVSEIMFSDYQEVDGIYFPFSIKQGVKDGQSVAITINSIELNPSVDASMFIFPEEETSTEGK
ncbi:MAG: outer membrane lipoprotein-sorting protein [Flavobacteriaceae bacterium]|nr:outer membrane lipoprotein-sorting protein [Flavobacteriaceae bacterium]